MDPDINPKINRFVQYPEGVTQETIQPLGPNYGMNGLRGPFDSWAFENRKLLLGGGLVVVGSALLYGLVALLK